ncbi:glycosyltransferase family 4 protein [Roseovarius nitratireducens]|uniref:glycosyltransferase family 4 protein n=1 Tax=Roseovarius nitratireducens TaxID=2044597 RepID=UPI000CE21856|nr:glycosyltransferase family 1 protein [Roseovarius nitratireducens]
MANVVYDLTEVFVASTGKYPYYGIVRVVEEIGRELHLVDPDLRFAIFSHAHDTFYEVHPSIDAESGRVELNIPKGVRQIHHLRKTFYSRNRVRDALLPMAQMLIRGINRSRWRRAQLSLKELDMTGKTLVSTGRPKHMVAALDALDRAGVSCEFIPLLHDMFPLHGFSPSNPKPFPLSFVGDNCRVINRASRIIAISRCTKAEIERFSRDGILPPLPEVVTVPLCHESRDGTEPAADDIPDTPYLLTVGATIGRKNLEAVFEAMCLLEDSGARLPRLVLAGAPRKHVRDYLKKDRYDRIRAFIDMVPSPNQTKLNQLYRNAMALVLPSRIEGWGLPAGEALWNGTPAICSTAPVLYEVCGELGLYFDPNKPGELAEIIARLQNDRQFVKDLRARIAASAASLRTWGDVARDVKRVYEGCPSRKK